MFKKVLLAVIVLSFLCSDIAYPANNNYLTKASSFQNESFRQFISLLKLISEFILSDSTFDPDGFRSKFKADFTKDATGIWITKDNWAIRFFDPNKSTPQKLNSGDELIYEENLANIKIQVYFKGLDDNDKQAIRSFLSGNPDLLRLAERVLVILCTDGGEKPSDDANTGAVPKNIAFGDVDEERDVHKGTFEEAAKDGRLFTKETINNALDNGLKLKLSTGFALIDSIVTELNNDDLKKYKIAIVVEEPGRPTMFYSNDPFASVLSHSGKRTGTIYLGLNTVTSAQWPEHRSALISLLLHESRDIERGYHMDLEDEVREGFITHKEIDGIYNLWNDLITKGKFGVMYNLYMERAREGKFSDYFLENIPANIRLKKVGDVLYRFRHGDAEDLPDLIELDLSLFGGGFSTATQVFVLRHCSDKIRYDRYKTIINDVKYLARLSRVERDTILNELENHGYTHMLRNALKVSKLNPELNQEARDTIRDYVGLEFKRYRSPDGAKIFYTVGGNLQAERTFVFLHGLGVNSRDWRFQISFFERDYKIIAVDLRGFGKSEGLGSKPPHMKNYSEDLEAILSREGIEDAFLVGHSMGGMVALNMEELYRGMPDVERRIKGLVLISTIAGDPTRSFFSPRLKKISTDQVLRYLLFYFSQFDAIWNHPLFKWLSKRGFISVPSKLAVERWLIQHETHPAYTRKVIKSVFKNDMEDLIYALRAIMTHNMEGRLKDMKVPVMWIMDEDDKIILVDEQEDDAKKIEDCTVLKFKNSKHYPHARYPRRVNKAIYSFINTGTYRFSQLVCDSIKKEYHVADVSLDELETNVNSLKMRLVPRLKGIEQDDLRLKFINGIAETVTRYGLETGVSNEVMIKAVLIIASQIISEKTSSGDAAKPIKIMELEKQYNEVAQSV